MVTLTLLLQHAHLAGDAGHVHDAQRLPDVPRRSGCSQATRRLQHQRPQQQEGACTRGDSFTVFFQTSHAAAAAPASTAAGRRLHAR